MNRWLMAFLTISIFGLQTASVVAQFETDESEESSFGESDGAPLGKAEGLEHMEAVEGKEEEEEEEEPPPPGIAGYDEGFFIQDKSGNYRLQINVLTQFRYYFNYRPYIVNEDDKSITQGFEFNKAILAFTGNIFTEDLEYELELEGEGGVIGPEVFALAYGFAEGWALVVGQFDLPVLREEIVDELGVCPHKSVVTSAFAIDVSQGVGLEFETEQFLTLFALTVGRDQASTLFSSIDEADLAFSGRFELKLGEGDWDRFEQFTSWQGSGLGALLGAAAYYERYGDTAAFNFGENEEEVASPEPVEQIQFIEYTVDLTLQGDGWNFFLAGVGSHEAVSGEGMLDDFGIVTHVAIFILDQLETFARFDVLLPDRQRSEDENDFFKTGDIGFNVYFVPHSQIIKLTLDLQYFFDRSDFTYASIEMLKENEVGLLPTAGKGEVVGKAQVQFMF